MTEPSAQETTGAEHTADQGDARGGGDGRRGGGGASRAKRLRGKPRLAAPRRAGRLGRARSAPTAATFGWLAAFLLAVSLPLWVGDSVSGALIDLAVLTAIAQWWGLQAGSTKVLSFLPAGFAGIGTYVWLALATSGGVNPVVALGGAAIVAGIAGAGVGALAQRLGPRWVSIASLVASAALASLANRFDEAGRGAEGHAVPAVTAMSATLRTSLATWLSVVVGVGSVAAALALRRSRYGLAALAYRDDADAAASLGVRNGPVGVMIWAAAAAATAMAGALAHFHTGVVRPDEAFSFVQWTVPAVAAATIGGLRTIGAPALGAAVYVALDRVCGTHTNVRTALAAVAILAVVWWLPQGVVGRLAAVSSLRRRSSRVTRRGARAATAPVP